jgi:PKD repeat protein
MKKAILLPLIFTSLFAEQLWSQCTDPNAQFEFYTDTPPIPTIFCEGGVVIIDNKSDETNPPGCIDHMTINWDFPYGATQTFTDFGNRSNIYDFTDSVACLLTLPKTFTIELCVYYAQPGFDNCITKQVKVRPKPVARFNIDNPICINDPNQCVTNTSCADSMWTWTFKHLPNGTPSTYTLVEPCHNFNQLGQYQITLIAMNSCGKDTAIQNTQVIDTIKAQGSISQLSGCGMMTVTLTDQSNNPPVVATSRCWTISPATGWMFVDSTNKHSQIAKVKLTQPGNYTITLEVEGVCNTNSKVIGIVHLAGTPSAQINGVNGGCLPHSITPTATNVNYANSNQNNSISWQFPGGIPSAGTGSNPGTVQYPNAGTFPVIMTLTNKCGSVADTLQITVGQPAETNVQLNGVPANGCGPFTVTLNNTSVGGTPKWWVTPNTPGAFTYANETSSTSDDPQITFNLPNTYIIHFSLVGAGCGSDTAWASAPIVVKTAPVANLAYIPPVQCIPAAINPDTLTSNGGDLGTTYQWYFPGGTPSSSVTPDPGTISYPDTGQFTITLVMQNTCGSDTASASFYVADTNQVVINAPDTVCSYDAPFQIQATPLGGVCVGFPSCIFNPGQVTPGLHVIEYQWGSGNCTVSAKDSIYVVHVIVNAGANESFCDTLVPVYQLTGQSPSGGSFSGDGVLTPGGQYSVAAAGFGQHPIIYSVDTVGGCVFSGTKNITVFAPPTAADSIPASGCVGMPIDFSVTSAGVTQCWWKFGDGSPTVQQCVTSHTYQNTGDYQVMLIVGNAEGCKDTLMQNIHITQPATAMFSVFPLSGCAPLDVIFTNESTGEDMQFL